MLVEKQPKAAGACAVRSRPSSVEVKSELSYTSLPHYTLMAGKGPLELNLTLVRYILLEMLAMC